MLGFCAFIIETLIISSQKPPKKNPNKSKISREHFFGVKPCTSDPECVIEETFRIKEQPGNENDLESSTTIAGRQEATK